MDVAGATAVERDAPVPAEAERVAFLAHWSETDRQSRSTLQLVAELQRLGYRVVVSSTSPAEKPLDFGADDIRLDELTVLRRPNTGYDFGSWSVAMAAHEDLLGRPYVLVLNDSLVGPFAPLDAVIDDFEGTSADVWGMVESNQFISHLQSFFRGFRYGVLAEPVMRRFWRDLRVIPDKTALIEQYEFGFSDFLLRFGFSTSPFVHHSQVVGEGLNPTIHGWRALFDAGVPFVKRELIRQPELTADGHRIPAVIADRYGTDVAEWL
ncbi:rhamnan synthesis F family protein [Blastococcus sp. CT_GayMR16]|uniref:rhamnan synthesis F family protein n=1 Tax=Blastococcus sp. CT_GayMR16 TaxID=2559607 RepID=UPI00143168A3|nr:rhamnan synthesis F family protein [Blastococcus sp. CT_GayMR16]